MYCIFTLAVERIGQACGTYYIVMTHVLVLTKYESIYTEIIGSKRMRKTACGNTQKNAIIILSREILTLFRIFFMNLLF